MRERPSSGSRILRQASCFWEPPPERGIPGPSEGPMEIVRCPEIQEVVGRFSRSLVVTTPASGEIPVDHLTTP